MFQNSHKNHLSDFKKIEDNNLVSVNQRNVIKFYHNNNLTLIQPFTDSDIWVEIVLTLNKHKKFNCHLKLNPVRLHLPVGLWTHLDKVLSSELVSSIPSGDVNFQSIYCNSYPYIGSDWVYVNLPLSFQTVTFLYLITYFSFKLFIGLLMQKSHSLL